jgi:DNA-binding NarL/FixJ family response regulator
MSASKTRVLLVDDHPLVRERLAEVINRERDLAVCGEAESRAQALELIAKTKPGLAIVDIGLKESHGLELIKDIHAQWPAVSVLVVSMHDESVYAERALRAGARGYITKQEATKNILSAIRRVLAGELYLSESMAVELAARVAGHPRPSTGGAVASLSDRELQVLESIGRGHGTTQIAEQLHLDVKTIETYRARIKDKLNLKDAAELLQFAVRWVQSEK